MPAATILYGANEQLSDAFKFREVIRFIRMNASNYLLAVLLTIVAGIVAGFGIVACCIGIFVTGAWAQWVQYHLLGQVYRHAMNPPAPLPDAPLA